MKIKKILIAAVLAIALAIPVMLAACGNVDEGTVPEYLGMTVSQSASASPQVQTSSYTVRTADAQKDDSGAYYAEAGKDIYVTIKLRNPDNFIILSFTLNGYHYQSYEFERGSTGEALILKCEAWETPGLKEYTIDNIKYINNDGAYKDVKINGEKTVKVNVHALVKQPVYGGILTYGDRLPAITSATTGGSIALDEGQTLAVGTKDYNWTFTPDGTAGYDFANTTGTISLTVNKAKVEKPAPADQKIIYSGAEQNYSVGSDPRYTATGNAGTKVGNYTANVILNDTANYEWADGTTGALEFNWGIAKAKITVEQPVFTGQLTYGDPLPEIITATTGGTIALDPWQTLTAGTKNYNWTFTPGDTSNYEWSNVIGVISLTVGKAIRSIPSGTVIYTGIGSSITEVFVVFVGHQSTEYEYSKDNITWQTSNKFTGLSAGGEYTFFARLKETGNYYPSEPISTDMKTAAYDEIFTRLGGTITGLTNVGKTLRVIDIPEYIGSDKITGIGNEAFKETFITTVTLPDSITSIGKQAFYDCNNLVSIKIPEGVTEISDNAFWDCDSLTSVILPDSLIRIGAHAFEGSKKLSDINIPEGVTSIDIYAFTGCTGLTNIELPEGIETIGRFTFNNTGLTSIKIPDSVNVIEDGAFRHCLDLASIEIGSGITGIGTGAFTTTAWYDDNKNWEDGALYLESKDGAALYLIAVNTAHSGTFAVKEGTKVIGAQVLFGCRNITSIILPESVVCISAYAFGYYELSNVYYLGTEEEWLDVDISYGNDDLTGASVYFYSETRPEEDWKYWRYVTGAPAVWARSNVFEAEYVDLTGKMGVGFSGAAYGTDMIRKDPAASNGAYIDYTNSAALTFEFKIISDQAAVGFVSLTLGVSFGSVEINPETFGIFVNGTPLLYTGLRIETNNDNAVFLTVGIGSIDLNEGENLIVLDILKDYPLGTAVGPIIDCMVIETNALLSWNPLLSNLF